MRTNSALLASFFAVSSFAMAQDKISGADKAFAQKAAIGGASEVEMGQMAAEKASDPKVKQFGQRMVTDHTKANSELQSVASKKNLTLPTTPDGKHKAMSAKMSKLSGAEFDRAYMKDMVSDHEKDVAEFQKQADNGSDSELKSFAASTLPTLREHLQMAKDTYASVNGGSGAGSSSGASSGGASSSSAASSSDNAASGGSGSRGSRSGGAGSSGGAGGSSGAASAGGGGAAGSAGGAGSSNPGSGR